jgi:hypothetical protein
MRVGSGQAGYLEGREKGGAGVAGEDAVDEGAEMVGASGG